MDIFAASCVPEVYCLGRMDWVMDVQGGLGRKFADVRIPGGHWAVWVGKQGVCLYESCVPARLPFSWSTACVGSQSDG